MKKPESISISASVARRATDLLEPRDPVICIQDPHTHEIVGVLLGSLLGVRGYCLPITHPEDGRDVFVHHITYYYDVEEMLTHDHPYIRAEGKYWLEQGSRDG